jgi:hypothetical protein
MEISFRKKSTRVTGMNQIIGPKLSKSETFYESLLTACLLKMVCWGEELSDPPGEYKKSHGLRA